MKPSATTLAQRFGFSDPDLTTPAHDTLLIWLSEHVEPILQTRLEEKTRDKKQAVWVHGRQINENAELSPEFASFIQQHPMGQIEIEFDQMWECPILNGTYTVGFCDMKVHCRCTWRNGVIHAIENNIFRAEQGEIDVTGWFEIKPTIPSLGELIRQLRMYQSYTKGSWFVVSPDARWCSQIESQGFRFIKAPAL